MRPMSFLNEYHLVFETDTSVWQAHFLEWCFETELFTCIAIISYFVSVSYAHPPLLWIRWIFLFYLSCFITNRASEYHHNYVTNHATQPCHMAIPHSHSTRPCHRAVPHDHVTQSCHIAMPHGHATQPFHTVMPESHATWPCHTTMLYNHATQPCHSAISQSRGDVTMPQNQVMETRIVSCQLCLSD